MTSLSNSYEIDIKTTYDHIFPEQVKQKAKKQDIIQIGDEKKEDIRQDNDRKKTNFRSQIQLTKNNHFFFELTR